MKKHILITIAILLASCSSSDDSIGNLDRNDRSNFSISLSAHETAVVDEVVEVVISSNEPMTSLKISLDNFQNSTTIILNLASSTVSYFSFDKIGAHTTVYFKTTNSNGDESIETYTPTISPGNAVKITTVQVLSFSNIDGTWDPEFSENDINRLADVFFILEKPVASISIENFRFQKWFTSSVKENQGDLTWELSSEDLYIDPQLSLQYTMADEDGGFIDDLMLGPPYLREISLAEYIDTKPSTITLNVPDIDL